MSVQDKVRISRGQGIAGMITKIVSGGQAGADRGGLDAAIYWGFRLAAGVPGAAEPRTA